MERGTRNLMRLDINTGKTENLSAHMTEKLVSYSIVDGAFYLTLQNGKESGVYRSDMNLENMTKLSDSIHPSMTYASVWNGKQYFYINYPSISETRTQFGVSIFKGFAHIVNTFFS